MVSGGGLEIATCCDLRVASETAQIGDRHAKSGTIGGAGATTRLPRLVGLAKAKELIFTGDIIDGKEAYRIGLVNQVFPQQKCMEKAMELARQIASIGSVTLRMAKQAITVGKELDTHESLHYAELCARVARSSPERQEGQRAFIEKREARFE